MELQYFKDYLELSTAAHQWVLDRVSCYQAKSLYIPAGGTPKGLYKIWEQVDSKWAEGLQFLQIDDVITGVKKGLFKQFFLEQLPSYQGQLTYIAEDQQLQADLGILGLGLNGHVAFHEPHMEADFIFGKSELSDTTKKTLDLEDDAVGLTYGAGAFLATQAALLLVYGQGKAEVFEKFLEKDLSLPVSHLHQHDDFVVMALEELRP